MKDTSVVYVVPLDEATRKKLVEGQWGDFTRQALRPFGSVKEIAAKRAGKEIVVTGSFEIGKK